MLFNWLPNTFLFSHVFFFLTGAWTVHHRNSILVIIMVCPSTLPYKLAHNLPFSIGQCIPVPILLHLFVHNCTSPETNFASCVSIATPPYCPITTQATISIMPHMCM